MRTGAPRRSRNTTSRHCPAMSPDLLLDPIRRKPALMEDAAAVGRAMLGVAPPRNAAALDVMDVATGCPTWSREGRDVSGHADESARLEQDPDCERLFRISLRR